MFLTIILCLTGCPEPEDEVDPEPTATEVTVSDLKENEQSGTQNVTNRTQLNTVLEGFIKDPSLVYVMNEIGLKPDSETTETKAGSSSNIINTIVEYGGNFFAAVKEASKNNSTDPADIAIDKFITDLIDSYSDDSYKNAEGNSIVKYSVDADTSFSLKNISEYMTPKGLTLSKLYADVDLDGTVEYPDSFLGVGALISAGLVKGSGSAAGGLDFIYTPDETAFTGQSNLEQLRGSIVAKLNANTVDISFVNETASGAITGILDLSGGFTYTEPVSKLGGRFVINATLKINLDVAKFTDFTKEVSDFGTIVNAYMNSSIDKTVLNNSLSKYIALEATITAYDNTNTVTCKQIYTLGSLVLD